MLNFDGRRYSFQALMYPFLSCAGFICFYKCQLLAIHNFLNSPMFAIAISYSCSGYVPGERRVLKHATAGLAGSEVMQCSANRNAGSRTYPVCKPHLFLCVGPDRALHISAQYRWTCSCQGRSVIDSSSYLPEK